MPDRSTRADDYQDIPRPVAAMARDMPDGLETPPHSHPRAQLIYATSGVVRVTTADAAWLVPPLRGVWMPAGRSHVVRARGAVAMRTLYIVPEAVRAGPADIAVIEVSDLLRDLILAMLEEPVEYDEAGRAGLIAGLILAEIARAPSLPLRLPMPRDARLARLCRALVDDPADDTSIEDWGRRVGASSRTLARLFQRETGLRFSEWRRQARLAEASARLANGEPVGRVAARVGYRSPSAFAAMVRRRLGTSPGRGVA